MMGTALQTHKVSPGWPALYYRARYYDPAAGRFLSEDPIGFMAGVNFYRYVDNSPVFWRDASGYFPSGPAAVMVASSVLPGRRKLEGNLDPLCRKGRNIALDFANLEESVVTREAEIQFYANHPDPNMRALAGDPGHLQRIENELETMERCRDTDPECDKKPEHEPYEFPVPPAGRDPNLKRAPAGPTSTGVGGVIVIIVIGIGLVLAAL
jgi:RHS repeat-associated protein